MTERTVSYRIVANVNSYLSGMEQIRAATAKSVDSQVRSKKSLDELGESMTKVGTVAVGAGALAAAGLAIVVRTAAEYQAKMAQLQTLSHANAAQMKQLSDAAMTVGQAYGYSASQVADAEIELTKAGIGVKQQLGGALTGALTLAAAGQIDVGQATEIATVAMTQFGLSAKDIPHLADLLSAGADKALGSVGDLGEALKNGGLQAHNMGLTIDDTVGTLAAFANSGIIGAEAGTQLRSMFIQLQNPSTQAKKTLDEYGISLSDASGKFVGITKLGDELRDHLGGLTQAQRNTALATVFGSHAITGATVLYQDSGAAAEKAGNSIQDWIKNVNDGGFAAAQAAGKLDSLQGDVTKLSAALQTDLIKAGSGANDALRGIVQNGTEALKFFGGLPDPIQNAAVAATALTAGVGLLGGGFLVAVPKVIAFRAALNSVGLTATGTLGAFGKVGGVLAGFATLVALEQSAGDAGVATTKQVTAANASLQDHLKNVDSLFKGNFFEGSGIKAAFEDEATGVAANNKALAAIGIQAGALYKTNEGQFAAIGSQLSGLAKIDYSQTTAGFRNLVGQIGAAGDQTKQLDLVKLLGPDYKQSLDGIAKGIGVTASQTNLLAIAAGSGEVGQKALAYETVQAAQAAGKQATELASLQGNAASATESVQTLANAIKGFGSTTLDAHSAERAFQQAIDDAKTASDKLTAAQKKNGKALDITTQAGRDNQAALENIASTAISAAAALETNGASQKTVTKAIADGRSAFIKQAEALGDTKEAAEKYADQLGLIPKNVKTAVGLTGVDAATRELEALLAKLNGIPRYLRTTVSVNQITSKSFNGTGPLLTKADGGAITGPGPKGKDSVLAYVAPGEHVLTAKEVDKMGGQNSVYRFRAGLNAYAAGGAIGDSTAAAKQAKAQAAAFTKQLAAAKKTDTAAQNAYDAIGDAKKDAAKKKAAKKRLDAADKRVTDLKKKLDDAKQKQTDAMSAAGSLRNDREDFQSTQRRATGSNPIDPLSYVDQLRSMSRDPNYSAKRQKSYDTAANKYEKSLVDLATQASAAATKLSDVKDASAQMVASVTSAIAGGFQASSASQVSTTSGYMVRNGIRFSTTSSGPSASSLASYYTQGAADSGSFAAQLKQLAGRGVNGQLLAEIAGYGVAQGAPIAAALLSASDGQIAQINTGYTAIQSNAATAGTTVADDNYAALIASDQASSDKITAQIASDGEALRKLIASAFGLKGYAAGTFAATPGLHLVGENGPEMLSFRGGERVWTAAQTQTYLRGTNPSGMSGGPQKLKVSVAGPSSVTIVDADGTLMGTFQTMATATAQREIAADAHTDSVLLQA